MFSRRQDKTRNFISKQLMTMANWAQSYFSSLIICETSTICHFKLSAVWNQLLKWKTMHVSRTYTWHNTFDSNAGLWLSLQKDSMMRNITDGLGFRGVQIGLSLLITDNDYSFLACICVFCRKGNSYCKFLSLLLDFTSRNVNKRRQTVCRRAKSNFNLLLLWNITFPSTPGGHMM